MFAVSIMDIQIEGNEYINIFQLLTSLMSLSRYNENFLFRILICYYSQNNVSDSGR